MLSVFLLLVIACQLVVADKSLIINHLVFHLPKEVDLHKSSFVSHLDVTDIVCRNTTLSNITSHAEGTELSVGLTGVGINCSANFDAGLFGIRYSGNLWATLKDTSVLVDIDVTKQNDKAKCKKCHFNLFVDKIQFNSKSSPMTSKALDFMARILKDYIMKHISGSICDNTIKPKVKTQLSGKLHNITKKMQVYYDTVPTPAPVPEIKGVKLYDFFESKEVKRFQTDMKIISSFIKPLFDRLTNNTGKLPVSPLLIYELLQISGREPTFSLNGVFNITVGVLSMDIVGIDTFSNFSILDVDSKNRQTIKNQVQVGDIEIFSRITLDVVPITQNKHKLSDIPLKQQVLDFHFQLKEVKLELDMFLGLNDTIVQDIIKTETISKDCVLNSMIASKIISMSVDIGSYPIEIVHFKPVSGDVVEPELMQLLNDMVTMGMGLFSDKLERTINGYVGSTGRDTANEKIKDILTPLHESAKCELYPKHIHHNNPFIVANHLDIKLPNISFPKELQIMLQGIYGHFYNINCKQATVDKINSSFNQSSNTLELAVSSLGISCSANYDVGLPDYNAQGQFTFALNDNNFASTINVNTSSGVADLESCELDLYVESLDIDIDRYLKLGAAVNDVLTMIKNLLNSNLKTKLTCGALRPLFNEKVTEQLQTTYPFLEKYSVPPTTLAPPMVNQSIVLYDLKYNPFGDLRGDLVSLVTGWETKFSMVITVIKKLAQEMFNLTIDFHVPDAIDLPPLLLEYAKFSQYVPQLAASVTVGIEKLKIEGLHSITNFTVLGVSDEERQIIRNSLNIGNVNLSTRVYIDVNPDEHFGGLVTKQVFDISFKIKDTQLAFDMFLGLKNDDLNDIFKTGTFTKECMMSVMKYAKILDITFDAAFLPDNVVVAPVSGDKAVTGLVGLFDNLALFSYYTINNRVNIGHAVRGIFGTYFRDLANIKLEEFMARGSETCTLNPDPALIHHHKIYNPTAFLDNMVLNIPDRHFAIGPLVDIKLVNAGCKNFTFGQSSSKTIGTEFKLNITGVGLNCGAELVITEGIPFINQRISAYFSVLDNSFGFDTTLDTVNKKVSVGDCNINAYIEELTFDLDQVFEQKMTRDLNNVIELIKNGISNSIHQSICGDKSQLEKYLSTAYGTVDSMLQSEYLTVPKPADPPVLPSVHSSGNGVRETEIVNLYDSVWVDLVDSGIVMAQPYAKPMLMNMTNNTGVINVPVSLLNLLKKKQQVPLLNATIAVSVEALSIDGFASMHDVSLMNKTNVNNQTLTNEFYLEKFGFASRLVLDINLWNNNHTYRRAIDLNFDLKNIRTQLDMYLDLDSVNIAELVKTKTTSPECVGKSLLGAKIRNLIFEAEYPPNFMNIRTVNDTDDFIGNLIANIELFGEDVLQNNFSNALRGFLGTTVRDQVNDMLNDIVEVLQDTSKCTEKNQPPDEHQHLSNIGAIFIAVFASVLVLALLGCALRQTNRYKPTLHISADPGNSQHNYDANNIASASETLLKKSQKGKKAKGYGTAMNSNDNYDDDDDDDDDNILRVQDQSVDDSSSLLVPRNDRNNDIEDFKPSKNSLASYYSVGKFGFFHQFFIPFMIFTTFGLRIYAITADVCTIHFAVDIEGQTSLTDELVVFTFGNLVHDFWLSKAYLIAILIVLGSCIVPVFKHMFMLIAWWAPMNSLVRGHGLFVFDQISKSSFVDVMFLSYIVDVFRRTAVQGIMTVDIIATPNQGVIAGMTSICLSILTGQYLTYLHQKQLRKERNQYLEKHNLLLLPQENPALTTPTTTAGFQRYIVPVFHFMLCLLWCVNMFGFIIGFCGDFMNFEVSGLASMFLDQSTLKSSFNLIEVLKGLIDHTDVKPQAYYTTIYLFTLMVLVPITFLIFAFVNLIIRPLFLQGKTKYQNLCENLHNAIYFLGAWCGYEVLWIASLATQLEINQIAEFSIKKHLGVVEDLKTKVPELCNYLTTLPLEGLPFDLKSVCDAVSSKLQEDVIFVKADMTSSCWWMLGSALACVGFVLMFQKYDWKYFGQPLPFPARRNVR